MSEVRLAGPLVGAVLFVLAALVPLVADGYYMSIAVTIAMYTALSELGPVLGTNTLHITGQRGIFRYRGLSRCHGNE